MPKYNGHKNWNHWNVAMWLASDEKLYTLVKDTLKRARTKNSAARYLMALLEGTKTPDGAPYTFSSVRAALVEL